MNGWRKYWETFPKSSGETNFLRQVGKTVEGKEISETQFQQIVSDISRSLKINTNDIILDLCCGNGLITKNVARICRNIVGIDYSTYLIEIARRHNQPENTYYIVDDVLNIRTHMKGFREPFSKIYMYEALQHFHIGDFYKLLKVLNDISADDVHMLFGSVPDRDKIFEFYNTPKRVFVYLLRRLLGREAIGTWWDKKSIRDASKNLGFQCDFFQQNHILHTSHYRFDVLVSRNAS